MNPGPPIQIDRRMLIEQCKRDVAAQKKSKEVVDKSIDILSGARESLDGDAPTRMSPEMDRTMLRLFGALSQIVEVQLFQLRAQQETLAAAIAMNEAALKANETNLLIPPGMMMPPGRG